MNISFPTVSTETIRRITNAIKADISYKVDICENHSSSLPFIQRPRWPLLSGPETPSYATGRELSGRTSIKEEL